MQCIVNFNGKDVRSFRQDKDVQIGARHKQTSLYLVALKHLDPIVARVVKLPMMTPLVSRAVSLLHDHDRVTYADHMAMIARN